MAHVDAQKKHILKNDTDDANGLAVAKSINSTCLLAVSNNNNKAAGGEVHYKNSRVR